VLDVQTVPRAIQKEYLVSQAKREIWGMLQRQIVMEEREVQRKDEDPQGKVRGIFDSIAQGYTEGYQRRPGIMAERSVRNFLQKLAIDARIPVFLKDADLHHDVMDMVDFVIVPQPQGSLSRRLPVGVQFSQLDEGRDISADMLEKKRERLQRRKRKICEKLKFGDLLFVNIPATYSRYFEQWEADGKPPGEPDRYWPVQLQQQIIKEVLEEMLSNKSYKDLEVYVRGTSLSKSHGTHSIGGEFEGRDKLSNDTQESGQDYGTNEYDFSNDLVRSLAKLSEETGVDLLVQFQTRVSAMRPDRKVYPRLLLYELNELLKLNGAPTCTKEDQTRLPIWLKKLFRELKKLDPKEQTAKLVEALFPKKDTQSKAA